MGNKLAIISLLNPEFNEYLYKLADEGFWVTSQTFDVGVVNDNVCLYIVKWEDKKRKELVEFFNLIKSVNPENKVLAIVQDDEHIDRLIDGSSELVDDFLFWPFSQNEFVNKIKFLSLKQVNIQNITRKNVELERLSQTDELTQLPNRRYLLGKILREISRTKRNHSPLSVIIFDIDRFKMINDFFGHNRGDFILIETARTFVESVRSSDVVGRYGGEEFLIILPDTNESAAFRVADKIRKKIENLHFKDIFGDLQITISGGVAEFMAESSEDLIDRSDKALYAAKNSGRNKVVKFSELRKYYSSNNLPILTPKILLIEDDPEICELINYAYRKHNLNISVASSGASGLALWNQNSYDMVLLDVGLPDMSGLEVCDVIKSTTKDTFIPVIFISGMSDDVRVMDAYEAGADDYIFKPLDLNLLYVKIKAFLKIKHQFDDKVVYLRYLNKAGPEIIRYERLNAVSYTCSKVTHKLNNILMKGILQRELMNSVLSQSTRYKKREIVEIFQDRMEKLTRLNAEAQEFVQRMDIISSLNYEDKHLDFIEVNSFFPALMEDLKVEYQKQFMLQKFDFTVDISAVDSSVTVMGKEEYFYNIFAQLTDNALRFNHPVPSIKISFLKKNRLEILFHDSGAGIPCNQVNRVFEPFFQFDAQSSGMGVGLTEVYVYVKRMSGQIEVKSDRESGTSFRMSFPLVNKDLVLNEQKHDHYVKYFSQFHALLIEDELEISNSIRDQLVKMDCVQDVFISDNGFSASKELNDNDRYNLYIIDLGIPGITGWQLLQEMKKRERNAIVIVITGLRNISEIEMYEMLKVDYVLYKPFELAELVKIIQSHIQS